MSNALFVACILTAALSMGLQQLNQCIPGKMLPPNMNKVRLHLLIQEVCIVLTD